MAQLLELERRELEQLPGQLQLELGQLDPIPHYLPGGSTVAAGRQRPTLNPTETPVHDEPNTLEWSSATNKLAVAIELDFTREYLAWLELHGPKLPDVQTRRGLMSTLILSPTTAQEVGQCIWWLTLNGGLSWTEDYANIYAAMISRESWCDPNGVYGVHPGVDTWAIVRSWGNLSITVFVPNAVAQ